MRKLLDRAAAVLVVCVFTALPTLARVQDRLSTHDDCASFRLSKNLERPHEKIVAATLASPTVLVARPGASTKSSAVSRPADALLDPLVAPITSRAPPVC